MPVIHACDGKLTAVDRPKSVNAKFNAGEKLLHGFLCRDFLFYHLYRFLRIFIVLSGAGNKFLENAILQFKAHRPVVIDFRPQPFHKIRVVITRMELDKLHLLFLLFRKECAVVKVPIADNIRSNFLGEIGLAGTGRSSENQVFGFNQYGGKGDLIFLGRLNRWFCV